MMVFCDSSDTLILTGEASAACSLAVENKIELWSYLYNTQITWNVAMHIIIYNLPTPLRQELVKMQPILTAGISKLNIIDPPPLLMFPEHLYHQIWL